jgi:hypothetical protein
MKLKFRRKDKHRLPARVRELLQQQPQANKSYKCNKASISAKATEVLISAGGKFKVPTQS